MMTLNTVYLMVASSVAGNGSDAQQITNVYECEVGCFVKI